MTPEIPAPGTEHSTVYEAIAFIDRVVYYITHLLQGPPAHAENEGEGRDDEMLAAGDNRDRASDNASQNGSGERAAIADWLGADASGFANSDDSVPADGSCEAPT